jgi:hypothetical protein
MESIKKSFFAYRSGQTAKDIVKKPTNAQIESQEGQVHKISEDTAKLLGPPAIILDWLILGMRFPGIF